MPALSLAEVQRRTRESLETFKSDYTGFEGDEAEFGSLSDRINHASSVTEIYELLQPDTFESY